jgi:hypothetical protein
MRDPVGDVKVSDIRAMSAAELIRQDPRDLEVPEGTEVLLSPDDPQFAHHFARVDMRSYEDLQLLGFIPRGLDLDALRSAIRHDDEAAQQVAHERLARGNPCDDRERQETSYGSSLRELTAQIRRDYHPALSRLLNEHYRTTIELDSMRAGLTWKWASSLKELDAVSLVASLFQDITVHKDATLRIDKTDRMLMASNIRIHKTGKIVRSGGYLKIWAHSISAFIDFSEVVTEAVHRFPWAA